VKVLASRKDNRRLTIASATIIVFLLTVFLVLSPSARAQPTKVPRIGYISGTGDASNQGPYVEALRQGLHELGYVEGKSFAMDYRGAAGNIERVPKLVTELIEQKVDIIVAPIPNAIRAAKQATKIIPVVMVASIDPVAAGLVESLAHPGGNVTGISTLSVDLNGKRLELLKEVVPRLSRIGVLLDIEAPSAIINLIRCSRGAPGSTPAVLCHIPLTNLAHFDALLPTLIRYSRVQSLPNCPSNKQRNSSWRLTSKPPNKSASPFRRMCWQGRIR